MVKKHTKKFLSKIDGKLVKASDLIDPKDFGLNEDQEDALEALSALGPLAMKDEDKLKRKRKQFSKATKDKALKNQRNRCASCGKKSKLWDYDHLDGDRTNNEISNCQALCPNCHAKKTRKKI